MKKILSLLLMLAMGLSLCACVAQPPQPQCIHIWKSATCKDVKTCTKCGEMQGGLVAHNYSEGKCIWCHKEDPNYIEEISLDSVFPGKPELFIAYHTNKVGRVGFNLWHKYVGKKTINYITITYTLYDRIGNPTPDDITGKTSGKIRFIGPIQTGEDRAFYQIETDIYCDAMQYFSIDSIYFEFADGTTAKCDYNWYAGNGKDDLRKLP